MGSRRGQKWVLDVVACDPVTPAVSSRVEGAACAREDVLAVPVIVPSLCDANAHRGPELARPDRERRARDILAEPLGDTARRREGAVRQDQDESLVPVTREDFLLRRGASKECGDVPQHVVAGAIAGNVPRAPAPSCRFGDRDPRERR